MTRLPSLVVLVVKTAGWALVIKANGVQAEIHGKLE
jgi:hypothetical protein